MELTCPPRYVHDYGFGMLLLLLDLMMLTIDCTGPDSTTWLLGVSSFSLVFIDRSLNVDLGRFLGGVTRTLSISYLRPVPIGSTVYINSRVLQHGRTMALIKGEMTSAPSGGVVYATAEHHKVNVPMISKHKEARVDWDDEMTTGEDERALYDSNIRKGISNL